MPNKLPVVSEAADLSGTKVLLRAALNVPIEDGIVRDDFRIQNALPTINLLREQGARVVILSHHSDEQASLAPVAEELQKYFPVHFVADCVGEDVERAVSTMQSGDVVLLENLRHHPEEKAGDSKFAQALADLGEVYVNDDFPTSHRAHASITGLVSLLPSYVGLTFAREYEELQKALSPAPPSLFILGGAKFDTKMPLVEKFLDTYDQIFIGGALVNDFFKGLGYEVGRSLVSDIDLSGSSLLSHPKILLPVDVVVVQQSGEQRVTLPTDVQGDEAILDVGPETIKMLAPHITAAKTILWNGPLGNYEGGFDAQTEACAKLVSESEAFSIVGGGDTVAAIQALQLADKFGFLSTAGGAMLTFLEAGTLPAIDVIVKK